MKQTAVTIMTWIAYILEWQKQSKAKILGPRDMFAHDTKFVLFLRSCFMYTEHVNNSATYWLDTPRPEPMTADEAKLFITPLLKLKESEFNDLCRFAEVTPEEVYKFLKRINTGE